MMQIYFSSLSLDEGFSALDPADKNERLVRGRVAGRPSGWTLFRHLKNSPIRCRFCGCQADQWVLEKGQNDQIGHPVLNLYATNADNQLVMMTRDHIIPRSLGGIDAVENLLPACGPCNVRRSNDMSPEDIRFAQEHPELIDKERITRGLKGLQEAVTRLARHGNVHEIARLIKPFIAMGYL